MYIVCCQSWTNQTISNVLPSEFPKILTLQYKIMSLTDQLDRQLKWYSGQTPGELKVLTMVVNRIFWTDMKRY